MLAVHYLPDDDDAEWTYLGHARTDDEAEALAGDRLGTVAVVDLDAQDVAVTRRRVRRERVAPAPRNASADEPAG
jgi:hypothetical protein